MAAVHRTRTIAAAQHDVWDILADFGAISGWADNIDHSCILVHHADPVGTARRVQIGRNTVVERITEFDPPNALAYDIVGLPRQLRRVGNRWTLRPTADGATAVTLTVARRAWRRMLVAARRQTPWPCVGRSDLGVRGWCA